MFSDKIEVSVNGMAMDVAKGTTLLEVSKMFSPEGRSSIIAKVDGHYTEMYEVARPNTEIELCDLTDYYANRVYVNGLIYLLNYAFNELYKGKNMIVVKHSADKAICIETTKKITKEELKQISAKMKSIVDANLPITRVTVLKREAEDYFTKMHDDTKVKLLQYITNTYVHLYKMGNMYNYILSKMPAETSCLKEFALTYLDENQFMLGFPTIYEPEGIKKYTHHEKLFEVFSREKEWGKLIKVNTAADLNNIVSIGHMKYLVQISETLQNTHLLEIAGDIAKQSDKIKIILMAGPSSSGKTTTCAKLATYLASYGLNPKMISMDNFFVERTETPKKENGEYDFECLEAVDLKLFSKTMKSLLSGKETPMPTFDFYSGEKKFKSKMKMESKDILLIEGIHALNPKVLGDIDPKNKFKIYLSPLTAINVDRDNRVLLTDNRLLRRIVRDNRTRGYSVSDTLSLWDDVRAGEEKNIFPFQDEADVVFNTSLIYEYCVLKTYVLPLLFAVKHDDPNYDEAVRLMKVLDIFLPIPSESIPADSLLREFIGNSSFE
jgi:uridine kinase